MTVFGSIPQRQWFQNGNKMNEYNIIFIFLFAPELLFVLCLPFRVSRTWWFRMIEDSDGDPHHTDGLFIILLFSALWCFRIGIIAGMRTIYFDKHLLDVAGLFLSTGGVLIGVRIAIRGKIGKLLSPNDKN